MARWLYGYKAGRLDVYMAARWAGAGLSQCRAAGRSGSHQEPSGAVQGAIPVPTYG